MKSPEPRERVMALLAEAERTMLASAPPDLPPLTGYPDVPKWHPFESALWKIGEDIRQTINTATALRGDQELLTAFHRIASDKRGGRGRQSFVLLFCYKPCSPWAGRIAGLLPDPDIDGHVISALYKMKAKGFSTAVRPYSEASATWIRKEALRYLQFDEETEQRPEPYR